MGASHSAEDAQQAAQQADDARRASIAGTTSKINAVYDSPERQAQYGDYIGAVRQHYGEDLGRQQALNSRHLKFSTAKSGLTGGSADITGQRVLGEEFNKGLLTAEDKAQGSLSSLKAQDESSRMNLIQLAQSGLDSTTAATRAAETSKASLDGARGDALAGGLGDVFGSTAATYKQQQEAAARRAGQVAPVGSLYGASPVWGR